VKAEFNFWILHS